jgi:hypothetical protein
LTLLSFTAETEIGIEMGANHKMKLNFFANWLCLTMDILQILVKRTWKDLVALQV